MNTPLKFMADGKTPRCQKMVLSPGMWSHRHQCSNKSTCNHPTVGECCKVHNPETVAARNKAAGDKWHAERDAQRAMHLKLELFPRLVAVMVELLVAEQNVKLVVDEYPAGTCNCEDAHKESDERMDSAEKSARKLLAEAKSLIK